MGSKLIKLDDGTLVEVETTGDEVQKISGGMEDTVTTSFAKIKPVLIKTCTPIIEAVKGLQKEIAVEQVEVEMGLSFAVEGNIYITKSTLGANIIVRMTLTNKEKP